MYKLHPSLVKKPREKWKIPFCPPSYTQPYVSFVVGPPRPCVVEDRKMELKMIKQRVHDDPPVCIGLRFPSNAPLPPPLPNTFNLLYLNRTPQHDTTHKYHEQILRRGHTHAHPRRTHTSTHT